MEYSYIQGWGTYPNETYVVVGMCHDSIIKDMKKRKFDSESIVRYDNALRNTNHYFVNAFVYSIGGKTVLWFREWKNDWEHYETLVHETNHMINDILVADKHMGEEKEALAYQQEYLFKKIRKTLYNVFKKKKLDKKNK